MLASRVALVTVALVLSLSAVSRADIAHSHGHNPCNCRIEAKHVCGRNGRTYYNACYAACNGVPYACEGKCPCSNFPSSPTKPVVSPKSPPPSCIPKDDQCRTATQCCACASGAEVKCWGGTCRCPVSNPKMKASRKSKDKKSRKSKDKKSKKSKSKDKKSKKSKGKKSKGKKSKGKGNHHRY